MKICILTPRFPFPQYAGDVLRINEIARHLKRQGHEIVLVSVSDEPTPAVGEALQLYDKVFYTVRKPHLSKVNSLVQIFHGKPMQCGYYYSNEYLEQLRKVVAEEKPDLFISHLLRMVPYLEKLGVQDRSIIEMTDAISKTYSFALQAKGGGMMKYIYAFERPFLQRYEQRVIKRFPKVVLVSQIDIDYLKSQSSVPSPSLKVHTNGVNIMPSRPAKYDPDKICFIGNMRYLQNQDAALYFAKEVFPIIKRSRPNAKFIIVGAQPSSNIMSLASNDIIITGYVKSLEEVISDSCVNVAPVHVASGIQNKVLIAMGCGIPVILTSLTTRSIPQMKDGENCLIRDDAKSMADACVNVMNDSSLREKLSTNGYEMVGKHYSWDEKLSGYEDIQKG